MRALNEDGCPECGLYSIAFAPDYAQSGLFYAYFTTDGPHPGSAYVQRLEELRRSPSNPDAADPTSRRLLFELSDGLGHQGGQLNFGPDGYLYLALGDGHVEEWAQDPTRVWGKLLRIDPRGSAPGQYSIPADNPFFDGAGPNADAAYASGLPQPLPVLVRPLEQRPRDPGRRPAQLGGDQPRPGGAAAGEELRLGLLRGRRSLRERSPELHPSTRPDAAAVPVPAPR